MRTEVGALLLLAALRPGVARLGKPQKPYMVRLWKSHDHGAAGNHSDHGYGHLVGNVSFGEPPQRLILMFSTTTGVTWVPSNKCHSQACKEHHLYAPGLSKTSVDIQQNGSPVDPKGGPRAPPGVARETYMLPFVTNKDKEETRVTGEFVSEKVCVGDRAERHAGKPEPVCAKMSIVVADDLGGEDGVLSKAPQDGIVGLSLGALAFHPLGHFPAMLQMQGLEAHFGFYASDDATTAELVFGGYDSQRMESPLVWVPLVATASGQWIIDILSVRVGGKTLDQCRGRTCRALVHTSSPGISFAVGTNEKVLEAVDQGKVAGSHCHLPDLTFEVEGVDLTLRVEDYAGKDCVPEIRNHTFPDKVADAELVVLGEPFLRRYYTVFDWENLRVGFSPATVERSCRRLEAAGLPTPGDCGDLEGAEEVAFFQPDQGAKVKQSSGWWSSWFGANTEM